MTVTPEILRQVPMFDSLADAELEDIVGCFTKKQMDADELLYLEGDVATSACFLIDGELVALKALPGGGETEVGTILPGTMIGEMALMVGGTRSATVRARIPSTAVTVSYYFFHAALDQLSVPAFKILRAIIQVMIDRLADLQKRILKQWDCDDECLPGFSEDAPTRLTPSFSYRPFLAVMPWLEDFTEEEIDTLLSFGSLMEVPRGEFLFREGSPAENCYLILRGAVERSVLRDRRYQLTVFGPGSLSGVNALIAQKNYSSDARIRSQALLLELDKDGFEGLFLGDAPVSLKFQNLVSANQLKQLKAADNLLAMLVSQGYVLSAPLSKSL